MNPNNKSYILSLCDPCLKQFARNRQKASSGLISAIVSKAGADVGQPNGFVAGGNATTAKKSSKDEKSSTGMHSDQENFRVDALAEDKQWHTAIPVDDGVLRVFSFPSTTTALLSHCVCKPWRV